MEIDLISLVWPVATWRGVAWCDVVWCGVVWRVPANRPLRLAMGPTTQATGKRTARARGPGPGDRWPEPGARSPEPEPGAHGREAVAVET